VPYWIVSIELELIVLRERPLEIPKSGCSRRRSSNWSGRSVSSSVSVRPTPVVSRDL